jgi:hypothetical protein
LTWPFAVLTCQMSKLCDKAGHKDRFVQTIESLIDRMPSSGDETTAVSEGCLIKLTVQDAKSYIRVIYLLSHDNPGLIDAKKADVLKDHLFTRPNNVRYSCVSHLTTPRMMSLSQTTGFCRCSPGRFRTFPRRLRPSPMISRVKSDRWL